jgi:hypothetical protein
MSTQELEMINILNQEGFVLKFKEGELLIEEPEDINSTLVCIPLEDLCNNSIVPKIKKFIRNIDSDLYKESTLYKLSECLKKL